MRRVQNWFGGSIFVLLVGLFAWWLWQALRPLVTPTTSLRALPSSTEEHRDEPLLQFGLVSDSETEGNEVNPVFLDLLQDMETTPIETVIHLGDSVHRANATAFSSVQAALAETPFSWIMIPGNHDLLQPTSQTGREYTPDPFQRAFGSLSGSEFLHPRLQLVRLNNADNTVGFSEADLALLERVIRDASNTSNPPTLLLAMHRPVRLLGGRALDQDDGVNGDALAQYDRFVELLDTIPADIPTFIVAGHIHATFSYEINGLPVLVTGGGGSPTQQNIGPWPDIPHWYLVSLQQDGSLKFDLRTRP